MIDRFSMSPMPMKGWLTSKKFKAGCVVTRNPIGGWLIYEEWPAPPDGDYILSFADEEISRFPLVVQTGNAKLSALDRVRVYSQPLEASPYRAA